MQSTVQEMTDRLTVRANTDPSFASQLLSDPMTAASKEFGRLPAGLSVRASRTGDGRVDVTIEGAAEGAEMTAEELEGVVGGDGFPGPLSLP